jgi:hypothetical protein
MPRKARFLYAALVSALLPRPWPAAPAGEPSPAYRAALRRTAAE